MNYRIRDTENGFVLSSSDDCIYHGKEWVFTHRSQLAYWIATDMPKVGFEKDGVAGDDVVVPFPPAA